jgi:hypothetical protein
MVLTRRSLLLGGGLLLVSGACRGGNAPKMSQSSSSELALSVQAAIGARRLTLSYAVSNRAGRPLFLFNQLHGEFEGDGFPLRTGGYVELENGSVVVSTKLFPVPDDMDVEKPNIPFLTRLEPNGSFKGLLTLELPLSPISPYVDAERDGRGETESRNLYFEMGYFLGGPQVEARVKQFPTSEGPRLGVDTFSHSEQRLQKSGSLGRVPTRT